MPACIDASVRSDGFMKSRPRIWPASACGSGCSCRRRARASRSTTSSRERSARSRKRFMAGSCSGGLKRAARRARRAAARRARPRARAAAACARPAGRRSCRRGCRARAVRAARPSPGGACAGRSRKPAPWMPTTGPTTQVSRICRASSRTLASRPSLSMMSTTASISAQAIGPPPKVVPRSPVARCAATCVRHQQRRAREAAAEPLGRGEHVGRDAVQLRRERLAGAAHAALHLVEDEQRAGSLQRARSAAR